MKVTFLIDLYMTGKRAYQPIEMDIPVLPRKTELVTINKKYINYKVAEIFHQIINEKQEVLILLVPTVDSDKKNKNKNYQFKI